MEFDQNLCNERHKDIDKKLGNIEDIVECIHRRLFIDNGAESYQSRINRMDRWIKGVCIGFFVLVIPILLIIARGIFDYLK